MQKYIGDLGLQDSAFDDTLALNAEFVVTPRQQKLAAVFRSFSSTWFLLCNYFKEKSLANN